MKKREFSSFFSDFSWPWYMPTLDEYDLLVLMIMIPVLIIGCEKGKEIRDFESDGCSLFPDRSLISQDDWCDCCFKHDILYWQGGTEPERLKADEELRDCILQKTGDEQLAQVMYSGVRLGGSPYFYNWYRWGYGWNYDRKYIELSEAEKRIIEKKLNNYFSNLSESVCH